MTLGCCVKKKNKEGIEMRAQNSDKIVFNGYDNVLLQFNFSPFCTPSFAAQTSTTIY
jgi:hypothetical protein